MPSSAKQPIIQNAPKLPNKQCPLKYCQQHLLEYCDDGDIKSQLLAIFSSNKQTAQLVAGCLFHSPFLQRFMVKHPEWVLGSLKFNVLYNPSPVAKRHPLPQGERGAPSEDAYFTHLLRSIATLKYTSIESAMRGLRRERNAIALHIALMDCGGVWGLSQVVEALTQTADIAVQVALEIALRVEVSAGRLKEYPSSVAARHLLPQGSSEEEACGIVIIAMGKHGAGELNYSSDIDLIALFDPTQMPVTQNQEPQLVAVKIIQTIVKLLDQHTADGHVFRVDLRLRPDPASTPLALSLNAAFSYYETVGQNWERAAMIKARAVAGQIELGEVFLQELTPFIWRKYFDYAAIADIHAMKRQIYVHKGHEVIAIEGHDIKLGRGGIREIEFFVQTQQLIYGGRRAQLRGKQTLQMLQELQADSWISQFAVDDLTAAYVFLRTIEHRLQMLNDEQTQRLPVSESDLNNFALFCGFTPGGFRKTLLKHLKNVEHHYAHLFESTQDLAGQAGNLIFTGTQDDPETLKTLKQMGFANPKLLTEAVRGWHFGRRKAVTSARARENLTELVPKLLTAFSKSTDPDAALVAFDLALAKMPASIELFAILKQNPALLTLFAELLGNAPRLADIVTKRPHVLDSLLDPEFVKQLDSVQIKQRIERLLARATSFEDFLNQARELSLSERFLVGARVLSRVVDPLSAGPAHSIIAEAFIEQALAQVRREIELRYGVIASAKMAILGLGKLGGREMSAASDLDLIVIYDAPEGAMSDGDRVLSPPDYYARITQRLVTALSAPMARGVLYDIDLRLRPSGRKGPVAVSLQGFASYHATEAETWEHMALTRARCVAGDALFFVGVEQVIDAIITRPRELEGLAKSIQDMRELVAQEKGDDGIFDLKLAKGGLLDIEFLAQYLVLGFAHQYPEIKSQNTGEVLTQAIESGVIDKANGLKLIEAWQFYSKLEQVLRISFEDRFDADTSSLASRKWLANMVDLPDFSVLKAHLKALQKEAFTYRKNYII
jgi:[glutamine synthetase] adenylyltransferase / [glutamine synthetase]-adenylyl-L-tyrosine phosphorylase